MEFRKAQTDKKHYRLIILENGLEVLLISDESHKSKVDSEEQLSSEEDEEDEEGGLDEDDEDDDEDDDDEEDEPQQRRGVGSCAVAMAVGVGSFHEQDQKHPHGLAHLLEHMLFMGSEKYPTENAYDDHLSKHGGFSNAFTEAEHTVYFFEVSQPGLYQAIDIFAQFFISPLMLKDSLNREINAVDSEFDTVRNDDDLRIRALWRDGMISPSHPYARFCWGNKESLLQMKDKDLRESLTEFYSAYYHVENMKLTVWSIDSLDEMEKKVIESFSPIPKRKPNQDKIPKLVDYRLPFASCLGVVHKIIPVNDVHVLRLGWQHSPLETYKSRPASYISHLLGHESQGGVLSYLKKKSWATEFWAGTDIDDGHENSTICTIFSVEVKLTKLGVENFVSVICAIFAYLGMLKKNGPQKQVFDEIQTIAEYAFEFKDEGEPSSEVCDLAVKLLPSLGVADRNDIIVSDKLLFDFVEKDVDDLMNSLNCIGSSSPPRVDLASSLFGREYQFNENPDLETKAKQMEEFWKTRYWVESFSPEETQEIQKAYKLGADFDEEMAFALPPLNKYLPTKLEVHPLNENRVKYDLERSLHPLIGSQVEIYTNMGRKRFVWLPATISQGKQIGDTDEIELKAVYTDTNEVIPLRAEKTTSTSIADQDHSISLMVAQVNSTKENRALADLLVASAAHVLEDTESYLARMAEIDITIKVQDEGFVISVFGFSEKLLEVLGKGFNVLFQFLNGDAEFLKENQYILKLEKENLIRNYKNAEIEPEMQANNWRLRAIVPGTFSKHELADVLDKQDDMIATKKFHIDNIEVLYHGNVNDVELNKAMSSVKCFTKLGLLGNPNPRSGVVKLKNGEKNVFLLNSDERSEKSNALHLYFQLCEDSPENQALGELLENIMEEPLFDDLRTKQQLGYVVSCGLRRTHGVLGLAIEITSSKFGPVECLNRVEAFLEKFRKEELGTMTDYDFHKRAKSLVRSLLQKDTGIFQETKRHWGVIFDRTYNFNQKWLTAHHILCAPKSGSRFGLNLKEVKDFFDKFFLPQNRKSLTILIVGGGNDVTNFEQEYDKLKDNSKLHSSLDTFFVNNTERFFEKESVPSNTTINPTNSKSTQHQKRRRSKT